MVPRTREDNERIRQSTQQKIYTAAMEVFIEKGYYASSIDDIAHKADISKGLMYHYKIGKEDLLAELVNKRMQEIRTVMEEAYELLSASEQLKHIVQQALDGIGRSPKIYRFFLNIQTQPDADALLSKYGKMLNKEMAELFELQCEIFEQMGEKNPRMRSLYFSSALQGAMLMISTYPEQYPIQEMTEQIMQEFLKE